MKTNLNQIISSTFSDKKQFEKYLKSKENCFVGWVDSYNAEMGYVNVLPAIQDEIVTQENVTIYKNKPFLINCWVIANTLNRNPQRGDKALLLVLDEKSNNFFKAQYSSTLPLEKQTSVNTSKAIKSKSNCVAIIVNPNYVSGSGQVSWGDIIGDLENQTDLINYLNQTYQTQINNLQENLSTETTNRKNADTNLQTQITNINNNLSNYVTISTEQTITGQKTFTKEIILEQTSGYRGFRVDNTDITRGQVTESTTGAGRLIFYDKDNNILGYVQQIILKDGTSQLQLSSQNDGGNATLFLNAKPDGSPELYTDNTIRTTRGSTRYLDANNGAVPIVLDRTGGQFNMLANMKSTNGVFCFGTYQNRFMITYTSNATIEAGQNAVDEQWWFNEDGSLTLINNKDASGTSYNGPALVVGGQSNQAHIEIDSNEIMAKSNATTPTSLFLNSDGGDIGFAQNKSGIYFDNLNLDNPSLKNVFRPIINNSVDLGTSSLKWSDAYINNVFDYGKFASAGRDTSDTDTRYFLFAECTTTSNYVGAFALIRAHDCDSNHSCIFKVECYKGTTTTAPSCEIGLIESVSGGDDDKYKGMFYVVANYKENTAGANYQLYLKTTSSYMRQDFEFLSETTNYRNNINTQITNRWTKYTTNTSTATGTTTIPTKEGYLQLVFNDNLRNIFWGDNAYFTNLNVSGGSTSVPTPPTNDNSTKIATTRWVNNKLTPTPVTASGVEITGQNDTVVDYWVASDGNTWYREWASGWIEQGGWFGYNQGSGIVNRVYGIFFPKPFANKNYYYTAQIDYGYLLNQTPNIQGAHTIVPIDKVETYCTCGILYSNSGYEGGVNRPFYWYACGIKGAN